VGQFSTEANNLVGIACRADGDYSQAGCCLGGASLVFNFNCCIAPQEAPFSRLKCDRVLAEWSCRCDFRRIWKAM